MENGGEGWGKWRMGVRDRGEWRWVMETAVKRTTDEVEGK